MDAPAKEESNDDVSDASEESAAQSAQAKLRDLKPEKDPIGADNASPDSPPTTR